MPVCTVQSETMKYMLLVTANHITVKVIWSRIIMMHLKQYHSRPRKLPHKVTFLDRLFLYLFIYSQMAAVDIIKTRYVSTASA